MKTLNEDFNKFCEPESLKNYKKVSEQIALVDNFFKDFEGAKNFFTTRDKWEGTLFQNDSRQGYESVFPVWIGQSLVNKIFSTNTLFPKYTKYCVKAISCMFLHNSLDVWSSSTCSYLPHVDDVIDNEEEETYICLINLNNIPVSTKFYTFNKLESCTESLYPQFVNHVKKIHKDFLYLNKDKIESKIAITRTDFDNYLKGMEIPDIELSQEVIYSPNQAILYPSSMFHSPNVSEEFTENNPRALLTISFVLRKDLENNSQNPYKGQKIQYN